MVAVIPNNLKSFLIYYISPPSLSVIFPLVLFRSLLCQDVFGADASGGQSRKVHVPLHCPLHVGGCRAEEQNLGGKFMWCVCP